MYKKTGITRNSETGESFLILLYTHTTHCQQEELSVYATGCQHGSSQLCRVLHNVHVRDGFPFLAQVQEVVLLSSYGSLRHLGCSALTCNVLWRSPAPWQHSPFCLSKLRKGSFCCSKNKSRDANLFSTRFRGQGVNFPECLYPEDFLLVPLFLELVWRQRKLYLLTAQDTPLLLWKKERKGEEEKMAGRRREGKTWLYPPLHKPTTLPNNSHICKGL